MCFPEVRGGFVRVCDGMRKSRMRLITERALLFVWKAGLEGAGQLHRLEVGWPNPGCENWANGRGGGLYDRQ